LTQGLYRLKPASQRLVSPIARWLSARGVPPDAVTLAAVPIGVVGGACIALGTSVPALLLVVPVAAATRLGANLLDGMIARETNRSRPMGEVWNELGDRIADVAFIGGLAFVPSVGPLLAMSAALAAVLASYAGITARAAGGRRQYGGVMSKPGRMAVLAVTAGVTFMTGNQWWLTAAAWTIGIGALVTLAQRLLDARRELR
jgi:phosphatidylglycerophosphate synthase